MVMRALPALIWMLPLARMILPGNYDNPVLIFILPGHHVFSQRVVTDRLRRAVAPNTKIDLTSLPEARDCLINVDVSGTPIPSSRFMGGREVSWPQKTRQ
jgi:hypothetical protein